jgi:L-seryl-tRNA(Ser) seleniumtransferase
MAVVDPHHTAWSDRDWHRELGLRPVINAAATLTRLGGSLMPPPVVEAMAAGARHFVELDTLQRAVGSRIAHLTHNEAAYVSSGAAGGIVVSVAACLAGTDSERIDNFPALTGFDRTEMIIHRSQRNGYDYACRQTGARMIEIEGTTGALEGAISPRTGAVLWFAGAHFAAGALPIETVIEIAHRHDVPVIVDAAAQIPAVSNLWHFTRDLGADLAIFSGGKGLRGPQSSGLVLGRVDLIEGCIANGSPRSAIGRPLKVGKEELFGILAAVEWTLAQDEPATIAAYEASVAMWIEGLRDLPGVTVERGFPSEAGQPHARAIVTLDSAARLSADALLQALWDGDPCIAVNPVGTNAIALNPQTLRKGEDVIVLRAIHALLAAHA